MVAKSKPARVGIVFIALLLIGGIVLMYEGNDAVALATKQKDGILTAEQVKLSFDSVSGRLVNEAVKEGQFVKKGDIIMQLDSTDTDLVIEKLKAQIAQMDAQINSTNGSMGVSFFRADTNETQSFRQIDQQRAAVNSAQATLRNCQLEYDRNAALVETGAVPQSSLDNARMSLDVAQANVIQQEQLLQKLLGGAAEGQGLPTIEAERQSAANIANDVEALRQQKRQLEVQLKELEVAKERLTLRAPEDGKILSVLAKQGEMVSPSSPVVLLESSRAYYDIYVSEEQAANLHEGDAITGTTVAGEKKVTGTIRLMAQAPGFADLKQTREKGQSDLSAFQVRIYIDPQEGVIPGMTIGVTDRELNKG